MERTMRKAISSIKNLWLLFKAQMFGEYIITHGGWMCWHEYRYNGKTYAIPFEPINTKWRDNENLSRARPATLDENHQLVPERTPMSYESDMAHKDWQFHVDKFERINKLYNEAKHNPHASLVYITWCWDSMKACVNRYPKHLKMPENYHENR